jgi:hypothetical protein
VTAVAAGVALQVVLVLGFGRQEALVRVDLGYDRSRPEPGLLDLRDRLERRLLLLLIRVEDRGPIARAEIASLLLVGSRVMDLEEVLEYRAVPYDGRAKAIVPSSSAGA